jgi:hypothetical protein
MMRAGWIRFRASLMAMRRTSWIDQRINDGVAMLLFFAVVRRLFLFLGAADWHDGGSRPSWQNHLGWAGGTLSQTQN